MYLNIEYFDLALRVRVAREARAASRLVVVDG